MSEQKFHLDLNGTPLEGYDVEEVAAALARLLRIPGSQARNLLRGKPSRIKRALKEERARYLMEKILACGAQCEITPSTTSDQVEEQSLKDADPLGSRQLETEQPEEEQPLAETQSPVEREPDEQESALFEWHAPVPEPQTDDLPGEGEYGDLSSQAETVETTDKQVGDQAASNASGRRVLLLAAAVLVLGLAVWAGLSFLGGSAPPAATKEPVASSAADSAPPKPLSDSDRTRQRMNLLARSVRIWMIQYGAGFDPSQVTMERMQQDLEIAPTEMKDLWGVAFRYRPADQSYIITSAGPDQTFDTEDDLKLEKKAR